MARYETGGPNIIRRVGSLFGGGGSNPPVYRPGGSDDEEDEPKKRAPIGVPEGYTATTTRSPSSFRGMSARAVEGWSAQGAGPGSITQRGPLYFTGDEWKPANNSPAGIGEVQKFLAAAGLLTGNWRYGVWDDKTRKAWIKVLGYANSRGITDQMALQELATAPQAGSGGGEGGEGGGGQWTIDENGNPVFVEAGFVAPPLEVRLPNRDDVELALRGAFREKLGVGLPQGDISHITDLYLQAVRQPQEDAYRQEVARMEDEFYGRPSDVKEITSVEAPSLETFADEEARRRDLGGYQATQVAEDYAPAFFDALGGYT